MGTNFFADDINRLVPQILGRAQPTLLTLEGPLGAGKTTFVKELLSALGYDGTKVQSPTFLKLLEYRLPNRGLCLHLDAYRLESEDDVEKLSLESYENAFLIVVEWPDLVLRYLQAHPWILKLWNSPVPVSLKFSADHRILTL